MDGRVFASAQKRNGRAVMPQRGERNPKFGVYGSLCCDKQIILREGAAFPDCPKHPGLPTMWKEIETDGQDVLIIPKKSEPAA